MDANAVALTATAWVILGIIIGGMIGMMFTLLAFAPQKARGIRADD